MFLLVYSSCSWVLLSSLDVCCRYIVTCHCLIGSFGVYLGLVVVLFAVICGTDAELPLCLCSIVFVVLLVIRWGSYFLSYLRLVDLPAIILLCTPSLLCALDVAPRSTCVRLFLLVFRYGICLMSLTFLAMVWEPSRQLWIVPLGYGLIRLFILWTYIYFLSRSFIILDSLLSCLPIHILMAYQHPYGLSTQPFVLKHRYMAYQHSHLT